jgi:hypothetical protein
MEECMICLEEKEHFIVFSCKHKTCNECFPLLLMYSTPCPVCEQPITMYVPKIKTRSHCMEYCKIGTGITIMSFVVFYLVNFAFKKH